MRVHIVFLLLHNAHNKQHLKQRWREQQWLPRNITVSDGTTSDYNMKLSHAQCDCVCVCASDGFRKFAILLVCSECMENHDNNMLQGRTTL